MTAGHELQQLSCRLKTYEIKSMMQKQRDKLREVTGSALQFWWRLREQAVAARTRGNRNVNASVLSAKKSVEPMTGLCCE